MQPAIPGFVEAECYCVSADVEVIPGIAISEERVSRGERTARIQPEINSCIRDQRVRVETIAFGVVQEVIAYLNAQDGAVIEQAANLSADDVFESMRI